MPSETLIEKDNFR